MVRLAAALLLLQAEGMRPRYGADAGRGDRIFTELKITVRLDGTEPLLALVRTLHPLVNMEKLVLRADATRYVAPDGKHRFEHEEARVEMRYHGEDRACEYRRGMPPEEDPDKLRQLMWTLAAAGRSFSLSPEGEYRSDDPDQDHNGEAMDLIALAVTRMPPGAVREGDAYEREWKGFRLEKERKGAFSFRQKVRIEKIEEREGRKVATLASTLTGSVDPGGGRAAATCEGKTTLLIEVGSGRVLSAQGSGRVVNRYSGTGEDGAKHEVTLTFDVEGKTRVH